MPCLRVYGDTGGCCENDNTARGRARYATERLHVEVEVDRLWPVASWPADRPQPVPRFSPVAGGLGLTGDVEGVTPSTSRPATCPATCGAGWRGQVECARLNPSRPQPPPGAPPTPRSRGEGEGEGVKTGVSRRPRTQLLRRFGRQPVVRSPRRPPGTGPEPRSDSFRRGSGVFSTTSGT